MTIEAVLDVLAAALLLGGAALALAASIGLLRFVDVISRMHAATKPKVVGLLMCLGGAAIRLRDSVDVWLLLLTAGFQLLTAPVSAHLVARLAYRTGKVRSDLMHADELAEQAAETAAASDLEPYD